MIYDGKKYIGWKHSGEILDYVFDWSQRLASGEVITTETFDVDTGLVAGITGHTDTTSTVWLSGGDKGTPYEVLATVTTATRVYQALLVLDICE